MSAPTFSEFTERFYGRLPVYLHDADERDEADDYPLKRYLAGLLDQAGELATILERIDYTAPGDGGAPGDTSELVDPDLADEAWLPWLAALMGVDLSGDLSEAGKRAAIASATTGWRAGTRESIAAAARTVLTGGQWVQVEPNYGGNAWHLEVKTLTPETPGGAPDPVLVAIAAARVKPAGVLIVHTTWAASWDGLAAARATWADWEAAGSWTELEQTGAP